MDELSSSILTQLNSEFPVRGEQLYFRYFFVYDQK